MPNTDISCWHIFDLFYATWGRRRGKLKKKKKEEMEKKITKQRKELQVLCIKCLWVLLYTASVDHSQWTCVELALPIPLPNYMIKQEIISWHRIINLSYPFQDCFCGVCHFLVQAKCSRNYRHEFYRSIGSNYTHVVSVTRTPCITVHNSEVLPHIQYFIFLKTMEQDKNLVHAGFYKEFVRLFGFNLTVIQWDPFNVK